LVSLDVSEVVTIRSIRELVSDLSRCLDRPQKSAIVTTPAETVEECKREALAIVLEACEFHHIENAFRLGVC
jgi:hypothetical protein